MTQQTTTKPYHSFVKGLITEAGPLTFPEDAALDLDNVVLNREGSIQRRLGMNFETDFVLHGALIASTDIVASFLWENAANQVANQFACVQVGNKVHVFNASQPSISAALIATVDLSPWISGNDPISAASGMGYLFLDAGGMNPFYLSYNPATNAVTATQYSMRIRDVFGVDDGLAVDEQIGTLSIQHQYNLQNQGWPNAFIGTYQADATTPANVYPANSQQWFVGKDSTDTFDPALLKKQDFGTSPAPRGRFVIDAFDRGNSRTAESGLGTGVDAETSRPSTVAFAFERLFHAGLRSSVIEASATRPNMTGFVFYSRTLRDTRDVSQYHTDADPTSEIDSELVATDGGFVNIPNSGPIYKLVQKGTGIVVFAENGIWLLEGDEGGFSAAANKVTKVSDFGVLSGTSVVDVEDAILYWNKGGIYLIEADPQSGRLAARSISENTIQTFYNSIDKVAKQKAVGTFDPVNRRVMWMYNDEITYDGVNYANKYNRELVLDLVLSAFYPNTISTYNAPSPYLAGYIPTPDFLRRQEGVRSRGDTVTKYLVVQFIDPATNAASFSYGYYRDPSLRDWVSLDGVGSSFLSYILTGYEIMGDSSRSKQTTYVTTHFQFTEINAIELPSGEFAADNPSGCIMQAQWDWANHPDSGKWGSEINAYRLLRPYFIEAAGPITYGHKVITNKHKVPGSGKSLSLYFRSDEDKDFYLYGWSTRFSGNSDV